MYHLGRNVYFTWGKFGSMWCASVRQYFVTAQGHLQPTKRGLTFSQKGYESLKNLIMSFTLLHQAAAMEKGRKKEGFEAKGIFDEFVSRLFNSIIRCRWEKSREPALQEDLRNYQDPLANLTDEEFDAAYQKAKESKLVESIMLSMDVLTANQFLTTGFDKFYGEQRASVLSAIRAKFAKNSVKKE